MAEVKCSWKHLALEHIWKSPSENHTACQEPNQMPFGSNRSLLTILFDFRWCFPGSTMNRRWNCSCNRCTHPVCKAVQAKTTAANYGHSIINLEITSNPFYALKSADLYAIYGCDNVFPVTKYFVKYHPWFSVTRFKSGCILVLLERSQIFLRKCLQKYVP